MSGWTNKGIVRVFNGFFRNQSVPTNFYVALVVKQSEKSINNAAAVDKGGGKVGIPVTAHGYATGAQVKIVDTTNYDGAYLVDATSTTNELVIVATFTAETFAGTETVHQMPGPDTNTLGDLSEIAAGNGYTTGGFQLSRNITDFDGLTEDDSNDLGKLQIKDVAWTGTGGNIPASGDGARYAVITDDNATVANREVLGYWDLVADRTVSDTQPFTLIDLELQGLHPTP